MLSYASLTEYDTVRKCYGCLVKWKLRVFYSKVDLVRTKNGLENFDYWHSNENGSWVMSRYKWEDYAGHCISAPSSVKIKWVCTHYDHHNYNSICIGGRRKNIVTKKENVCYVIEIDTEIKDHPITKLVTSGKLHYYCQRGVILGDKCITKKVVALSEACCIFFSKLQKWPLAPWQRNIEASFTMDFRR